MGKTLLHSAFKGGCGKTAITVITAYLLRHMGKRVLLIDLDPQANSSEIMSYTYNNHQKPAVSLYNGLLHFDLTHSIVHLDPKMDIIPSDWSLSLWPEKIEKYNMHDRNLILKHVLAPLKPKYDFILIDVPPTLSAFTNNALLASDYVSLVLQTQRQSYTSVLKTAQYMYQLKQSYPKEAKYSLLGVILYLVKKHAKTDREISNEAKKSFGSAVYKHPIWQQERIKVFGDEGIHNKDYWDRRALKMYRGTVNEELSRMKGAK
ncbi:ParA family protein [Acetilactobacillus jinshanensis]|uniref:ParA family protein n=1 Tax=Acetilactobacillus jinshanensis TaxID=1720083 RepID=A0A4P6ZLF5_9LACO|nr:ParA family protein [Acetilactobacillus jinshanensis]QBP18242.1 ParA family protein [Acetilactobacillus jinshanensis]URL61112.1 ParA family protein [uncultured bacterium]